MAVYTEERETPTLVEAVPAADPAPLGLAASALTTFILGWHNAHFWGRMSVGSRRGSRMRRGREVASGQ